jgi:hypothetical protein
MKVEMKGSSVQFVAKTLWITSPKDPRATWEGRTEEDIQQLLRRIEDVRFFGPPQGGQFADGFVPGN